MLDHKAVKDTKQAAAWLTAFTPAKETKQATAWGGTIQEWPQLVRDAYMEHLAPLKQHETELA
jgi:hypothetical protein